MSSYIRFAAADNLCVTRGEIIPTGRHSEPPKVTARISSCSPEQPG